MVRNETKGVLFTLASTLLWGTFPVMVHAGLKNLPPLTFAALSVAIAVVILFFYMLVTGKLTELRIKSAYSAMLMVSVCIVIIPSILFFLGASMTSGANTALLGTAEIIFIVLITPWFGEKNTPLKLLGAGGVLFGAILILYNGTWAFNIGDLLIIASTALYPVGNFFAKRAMNSVSDSTLLFVRFAIALVPLTILAAVVEHDQISFAAILSFWPYIAFIAVFVQVVEKIFWYKGLRHLDISKATTIIGTSPAFSLLCLVIFFNESVSMYQWLGFAIMMLGVFCAVKRPSTPSEHTRYHQITLPS